MAKQLPSLLTQLTPSCVPLSPHYHSGSLIIFFENERLGFVKLLILFSSAIKGTLVKIISDDIFGMGFRKEAGWFSQLSI